MMCGKKSTFVYLQYAIAHLLGPSHVCTTEFGPGEYTRWFLAWTFHRPTARSPLARMHEVWTIHVPIKVPPSSASSSTAACQEVVNRFIEYCRTLSDHSDPGVNVICEETLSKSSVNRTRHDRCHPIVRLDIYEKHDPLTAHDTWMGDETLPDALKCCLLQLNTTDRLSFLPSNCGHYLLDVALSVGKCDQEYMVHVEIDSYRHSIYGQKRVEKIKRQLEQEICRTSRRWRRLLQRQALADPKLPNDSQAMDES
jgi:hypothetical protein